MTDKEHHVWGCLFNKGGLEALFGPINTLTDLLVPQFWTLQEHFQTNAKILFVYLLHQEISALRLRKCSNDEAFAKIILDVLAPHVSADKRIFTVEMASELVYHHFPTLLDVFNILQPFSTITAVMLDEALGRDPNVAAYASNLTNTSVDCYVNDETRMSALKCLLNELGASPSPRMMSMTLKIVLCFVFSCSKQFFHEIPKVTEEIENVLGYTCDNQLKEICKMIRRAGCPRELFSEVFDKLKADFPELSTMIRVCVEQVGNVRTKPLGWIKCAIAKHPHFNWNLIYARYSYEGTKLLASLQYYRTHPYMGFEMPEEHKTSNYKPFAYVAIKLLTEVNGLSNIRMLPYSSGMDKHYLDTIIEEYKVALLEPNEARRGRVYVQQARQGMQPFYDALE